MEMQCQSEEYNVAAGEMGAYLFQCSMNVCFGSVCTCDLLNTTYFSPFMLNNRCDSDFTY